MANFRFLTLIVLHQADSVQNYSMTVSLVTMKVKPEWFVNTGYHTISLHIIQLVMDYYCSNTVSVILHLNLLLNDISWGG